MAAGLASSNRWTDEFLDSMRQVMDPLADDIVRELFEAGDVKAVNSLMGHLITNDGLDPEALPTSVKSYLDRSCSLPEWADAEKIRVAEEFFERCGVPICLSLMCGSLPQSYAGAKGVQVLYLTARLRTAPKRRIGETAQMIINALSTGGLAPGGQGIRDAQKVRLMHAAVRHLILRSGEWNPEWDQPINQEDLEGTLMAFTVTILDSLQRLEVKVEPDEAECYLHAWKVIGHIMGLRAEVLPEDLDDAHELMQAISRRQFAPSEAGREMAVALIEMLEEQVPGTLFKGMPATMIRHLIGDETSDMIDIPRTDWTSKLIGPSAAIFNLIEGVESRSSALEKAGDHFTHAFLEGIAWFDRGGRRASFSIPTKLRQKWGIRPNPGAAVAIKMKEDIKSPGRDVSANSRTRLFLPLLAASAVLIIPLLVLTAPLVNSTARWGIVSLELAGGAPEAQAIIASWSGTNRIQAAVAIGFAPLFLILYSGMAMIGCVRVAGFLRARRWSLARAGGMLAWGQGV
ncbi:MAG TPA: oxygenase MpaB family protein, partial [Blastocatellia bacterium]|nr:oxygenase MpaB family protein [Blastocatellia bacterium]